MLSILIPTYNYNIVKLVTDLQKQATEQQIEFELIVMEDGSDKYLKENSVISNLPFCKHILLKSNIGRAKIRNKLAETAKFDYLLYMDCDAQVLSSNYIEKYLGFCKSECIVIGGTAYDENEKNPEYSLRLKYGRIREARTAPERIKSNFATFNFLISKNILKKVQFDEKISGYGYEDMVFGHQLINSGYEFIQIENPLIHMGLDNNQTFIQKTETGCKNLLKIYKSGNYPFLKSDSKLLKAFISIETYKIIPLFSLFFDITNKQIKKQICGRKPSLLLYDVYKLLYLCKTSASE